MSDTQHRDPLQRRDDVLRDSLNDARLRPSGAGGLYWIVGSAIVLLIILSLFLFGDATPALDPESTAPIALPSDLPGSATAPLD